MRFVLLAALVVGCSTTKPNPTNCLDGHCNDPGLPFCDVDGAIGGEPNTCISVACTPNEFEACRGDSALTCNATGDSFDVVACEFGCGTTGCKTCDAPECEKQIVPKYVPSVCSSLSSLPTFTLSSSMTLDTSNDLSCSSVVGQPTGPEICVLHYNTISIERNQTLTVIGTRALALVADRALTVDGILDVSGSHTQSGPGGGLFISGASATQAGGGAGYRHAGGNSGTDTDNVAVTSGGAARPNPSTLTELFGGARSASGRSNGGGAVTLISCRDALSVPGLIDAGGGGGTASAGPPNAYTPPTGGGAGGTIVLQGMTVSVTGEIYANGGGGGGGGFVDQTGGGDGTRSTTAAAGGAGSEGGRGGTSQPPTDGQTNAAPGAGGGSAGYVLIYTPELVFPTLMPVAVSPGIEPKLTVGTN